LIRHADPRRDAAACAAIYAPHVEEGIASFEEVAPDEAETARRIERYSATHAWLVCERDGEVVGYAYAMPLRERPAYRWTIELSVYVAASHARQGVARELYEGLLDLMRRQGYRMALAGITLPNDASVRLHESFGFESIGVFRAVGWKAGGWRDVGWWRLALLPGEQAPDQLLPPQRLSGGA